VVLVEDDGIGIQDIDGESISEHHYGLVGMKERALMIGASLNIRSDVERGTTVALELGF